MDLTLFTVFVCAVLFPVPVQSYVQGNKCFKPINLILALDASGSMEPPIWQEEVQIAKQLIQANAIEGSGNRYSILDFSTNPLVRIPFTSNVTKATFDLESLKEDFRDGQSNIDFVLEKAAKIFETENSSGRLNIFVIITDGYMTFRNGKDNRYYLKPPRDKLVAGNSIVFAVGIGSSVDWDTLGFIATDPVLSHVFKPDDTEKLVAQIKNAAEIPCQSSGDCGNVMFERIGCFKDKGKHPRPLPDLILTDRDPSSSKYSGQTINWKKWDTYLPDFVCRCAKATAKEERNIFGLQFYGECWSSAKMDTFDNDGRAEKESNCKTLKYEPYGKCYAPLSLVIALDTSGSIDSSAWLTEVGSAKEVILTNKVENSGNKFAIISFSTNATVIQAFTTNASQAIDTLENLQKNSKDGHTYIDAAVREAGKLFESQSSEKEKSKKVFITFTDGYMTYRNGEEILLTLHPEVAKLNSTNTTSFAVGIGKPIKDSTLYYLASPPELSHVFYKANLGKLGEAIKSSAERPCREGEGEEDKLTVTCKSVKIRRAGTGCYRDTQQSPRPLPDLLFSDREVISWTSWDSFMQSLVCKCAEESAKQQRKIFGLQYYGECWSSTATDTYAKDGPADQSNCPTLGFKPCNDTTPYCVGSQSYNYVYDILGAV
eukprot:gene16916-8404_t